MPDRSSNTEMRTCPLCQREFDALTMANRNTLPFCGDRCRNVDLFRWMEGRYAIAEPVTDPELLDEIVDRLERGDA